MFRQATLAAAMCAAAIATTAAPAARQPGSDVTIGRDDKIVVAPSGSPIAIGPNASAKGCLCTRVEPVDRCAKPNQHAVSVSAKIDPPRCGIASAVIGDRSRW